jgi:hypothetical protein
MSTIHDFTTTRPGLSMEPTTFRTFRLRPIGAGSGAAPRIVQSSSYNQRVVVFMPPGQLNGGLVSTSAAELNIPAQAFPGEAYTIPVNSPQVLVLVPGQHLDAAGPNGTRMSVSVSQDIPRVEGLPPKGLGLQPTQFRTYTLPVLGVDPAIRIVPTSRVPRRVRLFPSFAERIFVSDAAEELNIPQQPTPGNAFEVGEVVLVLAPWQALYAAGPGGDAAIEVIISDIHLPGPEVP